MARPPHTPASVEQVTDPGDPRLADYVGLRDPATRVALEGDEFFVAEGPLVVRRLLASAHRLRSVVVTPNRLDRMLDALVHCPAPVYVVPREVLAHVAGFDLHRGVIAAADRPRPAALTDVLRTARTLAVLEGLNDHENLGAIARTARALGVDALVLDPTCADPWYRRTVRVSMGEILFLPIVRAASLGRLFDELESHGVTTAALTPHPDATDLWSWQRPDGPVALLLGAEGPGLSEEALRRATVRLRIPIRPEVDSLNVGHAAAIAFAAVCAAGRPDQR